MKYILTNIPRFIIEGDYDLSNLTKEEKGWHPLKIMGGNSGNCMFWESTKKIIQSQTTSKLLNHKEYNKNRHKYANKIDKVVLVTANTISPKAFTQLNYYYGLIKSLNCKKYLFSAGAQNNTIDLIKFSERERNVYNSFFPCFEYAYLRGQYTYDLLKYNKIPVSNIKAVGCPSILLKPIDTDNLKAKFKNLYNRDSNQIKAGINFPNSNQNEKLRTLFKKIMSDKDVFTLVVDDTSLYDLIHGNKNKSARFEKHKDNLQFSNNVFNLINFFKDNVDFMFGTRIHGTVLGLCAGLPSMCLAIDSRTYELCEQMNIPYINCIDKQVYFNDKNELVEIFKNNFDVSKIDQLKETIKNNAKLYKIN